MRTIDADVVGAALGPKSLIDALREAHRSGNMAPVERLLLQGNGGDAALMWAGWDAHLGIAVKAATVFPRNSEKGALPNIQSVVVLFDSRNGRALATIHGESFTRMKTAATSALAADVLARHDVGVLAVLGAGAQAETQVLFHLAARPSIERVLVWNRTAAAAERLVARLNAAGHRAEVACDPETAVRGAGLVTCLTAATFPVLHGAWLAPGSHVDLVGAYTPTMRESDDVVVLRGRLFADSMRFGVTTCGDYAIPIAAGTIPAKRVEAALFDLCSGRAAGRLTDDEVTVCKNGGGGHLDLMAARAFCDFVIGRDPASGATPLEGER